MTAIAAVSNSHFVKSHRLIGSGDDVTYAYWIVKNQRFTRRHAAAGIPGERREP